MKPFTTVESALLPLPDVNVDTDQLTPARFLKSFRGEGGYGGILFYDRRFDGEGEPRPDFVLNQEERRGASVLVAGENFGCGSSRETAVWALVEYGIRAVISTSFGDIFKNNAQKNGLLPLIVDDEVLQRLFRWAEDPKARVRIDLESTSLELPDGAVCSFPIDSFYQECLLKGLDPMGYLLEKMPEIESWEAARTPRIDTVAGEER